MEFEKAKIIVGGDSGVGKTALVHLICNDQVLLHPSYTVGCTIDIKVHMYEADPVKNKPYFLEFWDIGGSNSHSNTRSVFYQNLHGLILVYDCTNKKSQSNLRKWLCEVFGKNFYKNSDDYGYNQFLNQTPTTTYFSSNHNNNNNHNNTNRQLINRFLFNTDQYNDYMNNHHNNKDYFNVNITLSNATVKTVVNHNRFMSNNDTTTTNNNNSDDNENKNNNNSSAILNHFYPAILVIGTKTDLLNVQYLKLMPKVSARFNDNTYNNDDRNLFYSPNGSQIDLTMTPKSCIPSVHIVDYCDSKYNYLHQQQSNPNIHHHQNPQSVHVDLVNSKDQSSDKSSFSLHIRDEKKLWNFASEHGFSELLLNCNSLSSLSSGSAADRLLNRFFDEVIRFKLASTSMGSNRSPEISRAKRRYLDTNDSGVPTASNLCR